MYNITAWHPLCLNLPEWRQRGRKTNFNCTHYQLLHLRHQLFTNIQHTHGNYRTLNAMHITISKSNNYNIHGPKDVPIVQQGLLFYLPSPNKVSRNRPLQIYKPKCKHLNCCTWDIKCYSIQPPPHVRYLGLKSGLATRTFNSSPFYISGEQTRLINLILAHRPTSEAVSVQKSIPDTLSGSECFKLWVW